MQLDREYILRMIKGRSAGAVVVEGSESGGGGGGVTLGPLLTSLNAEAMPVSEGYLHWTGSAWAFDTPTGGDPVDLTPYALKTWVQTNYASKDDIADFITESQAEDLFAAIDHTHANYLPLSAGPNKALTGSLYITGSNGIQWAGSPGVGMLCYMPSSGWTGISASQWGVGATSAQGVIRSNANDILHYRNGTNYKIWDAYNFTPSDYLPLTGGTVQSLTVTNGLDADSITVGSIVNSDTLAEYLDQDASDARYLQLTGGTLTGNLIMNGANVAFGTSGSLAAIGYYTGALRIGAAAVAVSSDGVFTFNGHQVATQPWVTAQLGNYLPLTGGTVNGNLNVKGTIQAQDSNGNNKVIIYGTTGNIRAEKVYIGGSTSGYEAATHDWVTGQGYQANIIESVKVNGTALTTTNKAVDIPAATSDGVIFGVVAIGTGFTFDEGRLCVDTSTFATRTWADGRYLPLSAGPNKALTGSLYITGSNGIQWAGSPGVGMLCYMPSSGWTGISASQWGVGATSAQGVIRSNANDILHYRNGTNYKIWDAYNFTPSDYLPLAGGTVESLTVTNGLDADSITVSSLVNSDTLAEYLDQDASDARYLQLTGGTLTGNLIMNGANVAFGTSGSLAAIGYYTGALRIGAAAVAVSSDGVFTFNGDQVATQPWVTAQLGNYLPLTGGTVNGNLNVKGTIQAQDSNGNNKVIIYGTTGNIRAEKVYIGGSTSGYEAATHDWVTGQGYQANIIESVKVNGTALTPTNKAVDIPAATSDGVIFGVVAIGTGFTFDEGRLCVDTSTFATRTWADGRYLPLSAGSSKPLTGELFINKSATASATSDVALAIANNWARTDIKDKSIGITIGASSDYYFTKIATVFESQNPDYLRPALAFYTMDSTAAAGTEVERMRIAANGNVGIGTNSPIYKLDVRGNVSIGNPGGFGKIGCQYSASNTDLYNYIALTSADSNGDIVYQAGGRTASDHVAHLFKVQGSSTALVIRNNGNVGIGTTSPAYKLDVNGNTGVTGSLDVSIELSVGDVTNGGVWLSDSALGVWTMSGTTRQDTELMSLASGGVTLRGDIIVTGKMAVNTTSFDGTNAKLQVTGNITATGGITSKSSVGNVVIANNAVTAATFYANTVIFGSNNNDAALYVSNGHVWARNSSGTSTMII